MLGLILSVGSFFLYQEYQISALKKESREQSREVVRVKIDKKNEIFEERWRTIAEESEDETIILRDGNGTTIIEF
jgi:hypothetical protein